MNRPAQLLTDIGALQRRTPALVFAVAVLSLGLIVAGKVAVKGIRSSGDTITVTGASTERITSDFADWRVEVSTTGPTQQASYRQLLPQVERTRAFLKAQGLADGEVELGEIRSNRQ